MDGVEGSRSTSTSAMLTNSARARAFGWVAARNFVRRLGALGVDVGVSGYSTPVLFHLVMFREMQTRSFHPAPLDRYPRLAVVVKTT